MSNKPHCRRTADRRRRRWGATGTAVGIAVGGAMAAAFVSMGNASADDETVVPENDAFTELAQLIDGNSFTSAGAPNDLIGTLASELDSQLGPTVFGPELDTIADQIIAGAFSGSATGDDDAFTDLAQAFDPFAFDATGASNDFIGTTASQLDTLLAGTVYAPELDVIADQIISAFTTTAF